MNVLRQMINELKFANGIVWRKPFQCLMQVTNRCNMRCQFCDFWPNFVPRKEELSIDDYRRLSRDLSRFGSMLFSIEGGEPLVREDLADLIQVFAEHHLPILFTNGWYVTDELARKFFRNGLHQVGVSIDFADAEKHDRFRAVDGAFDKAVAAVKSFKRQAPRKGAQVHVISVLMRDNEDQIEDLLRLSRSLGVGHQFTLLSNSGYRRSGQVAMPKNISGEKLLQLRKRYPHFRTFSDYLRNIENFLRQHSLATVDAANAESAVNLLPDCKAGLQSFNIDHIGNVSACIEKIDKYVGNIKNESIFDCLQRLRQLEHVNGCQDCWTLCRGMTQGFSDSGDWRNWKDLLLRRQSV